MVNHAINRFNPAADYRFGWSPLLNYDYWGLFTIRST
jgi:hypothetical protein